MAGAPPGRAAVGQRAPARAVATGTIAGARSPRGNSLPDRMHRRQQRRARREGEDDRLRACARPAGRAPRRCRRRGSGSGSPSRRHGRSGRARGSSMSPTTKSTLPAMLGRQRARARCRPAPGEMSTADHSAPRAGQPRPPARRCRSRHRAGAARSGRPAAGTAGRARIWSRPARTVARMPADRRVGGQPLPGLGRGAVEIGLELAAAWRRRRRRSSVEPQKSKISRSFIGAASSGSVPAHSVAARRMYSSCARRRRPRASPSRTASFSSGGDRRIGVEIGEMRQPLEADGAVEAVDLVGVRRLRLAITPPSRTW